MIRRFEAGDYVTYDGYRNCVGRVARVDFTGAVRVLFTTGMEIWLAPWQPKLASLLEVLVVEAESPL